MFQAMVFEAMAFEAMASKRVDPTLDELIGDLRREAAGRRASPDFPVEEEAVVSAEMDRLGPEPPGAGPAAAVAAIDALRGKLGGEAADLADLAGLTASALRNLTVRLGRVERLAARLVPASSPAPAVTAGDPGDLSHWAAVVTAAATGRVLVAGPGCGPWVACVGEAGGDVYGVDPCATDDNGALRAAPVLDHLRTVGTVGLVVLAGPVAVGEAARLDAWAAEMRRAATSVVVVSESPWWWRLRVGTPVSDTSGWRPVSAETWLEVLAGAGFEVAARYRPGGRDYCVAAGPAVAFV